MSTQVGIPTGRPFTVADLEAMPDDGNRYELIDGMLIVDDERMGVASYWLLDPAEPGGLTVLDLVDGRYVEVASVTGDEPYRAQRPFPVTIVPARLLDGTRP